MLLFVATILGVVSSNPLKQLLTRLNAAAARRGKKSELARVLGVDRSRVTDWLAGRHEPGAEITLRLLEWAQAEENNQRESPGSATTPPEPKAQLRNSSYEKTRSDRKHR